MLSSCISYGMQDFSHSLSIDQRKSIAVSGVEGVKAFSESRIELILHGSSTRLTILGSGLKITAFSKTSGAFSALGTIECVKYGGGFKDKIFR